PGGGPASWHMAAPAVEHVRGYGTLLPRPCGVDLVAGPPESAQPGHIPPDVDASPLDPRASKPGGPVLNDLIMPRRWPSDHRSDVKRRQFAERLRSVAGGGGSRASPVQPVQG